MLAKLLEHYGADLTRVREYGWNAIRCPFHADKLASGSVNLDKGVYVCHGCEVKGSAINIIMKQEGLSWSEACNWAASVLGERLDGVSPTAHEPRTQRRSRYRARLFD